MYTCFVTAFLAPFLFRGSECVCVCVRLQKSQRFVLSAMKVAIGPASARLQDELAWATSPITMSQIRHLIRAGHAPENTIGPTSVRSPSAGARPGYAFFAAARTTSSKNATYMTLPYTSPSPAKAHPQEPDLQDRTTVKESRGACNMELLITQQRPATVRVLQFCFHLRTSEISMQTVVCGADSLDMTPSRA